LINTYRFNTQSEIIKDEKKQFVDIPAPIVLNRTGAMVVVTITHPISTRDLFKKEGKNIPIVSVPALIDTGASSSVISPAVADKLDLVHTGYQKVTSVQDEQRRPVYYGAIMFPWGSGKEIPLVCCPLKGLECLIGRDILLHWNFIYNGVDGSIIICD